MILSNLNNKFSFLLVGLLLAVGFISLPIYNAMAIEPDERNLTDHERWMTENYTNQEYSQMKFEEECLDHEDKDVRKACKNREVDFDYRGTVGANEMQMISQMYGLVVGMGFLDGGFTKTMTNDEGNPVDANGNELEEVEVGEGEDKKTVLKNDKGEEAEQGEEDANDYCRYIATATETAGMAFQQSGQDQIHATPMDDGDVQRQSILRAARAHDQRADTAKMQAIGWSATTACYVYMTAKFNTSFQGGAKLVASGILTDFWWEQKSDHEKFADKMRGIADKMPSPGDCNPIDDVDCYCSIPSNKMDPKYCLPETYAARSNGDPGKIVTSCVDDELQDDPECGCLQTNSCYDVVTKREFSGVDFGSTVGADPLQSFQRMMRGEVDSGSTADADFTRNRNAIRQRAKREIDNLDIRPSRNLTQDEQKRASELASMGFSDGLAAKLVTSDQAQKAMSSKNNMNQLSLAPSSTSGSSTSSQAQPRSRVVSFSGGRGLGSNQRNQRDRREQKENPFDKFLNQEEESSHDSERVMHFRGRAAASQGAQISNNKQHSVFDIISHRYRRSAWKRLELDY